MKQFTKKILLTSVAIMTACIIVYGMAYAQQPCCRTILDDCIPTSSRILVGYSTDDSYRISPLDRLNNPRQSNLCSNCRPADFDPGNACCETDRCDNYGQTTEFSPSFIQEFRLLQKSVCPSDTDSGAKASFEQLNLFSPHKPVPIYILKESIIC